MASTVAIDFGTSRTKLAYIAPGSNKPEVMRLGDEEQLFVPSLFYLFPNSEQILWGSAAAEMLAEDPAGVVDALKRRLRDPYVRANRRRVRPVELLTLLFAQLREKAGQEIPTFGGTLPKHVVLTLPALYGPPDKQTLKAGAEQAGFEKIELVPEPVAAARAWLTETGANTREVVVLDCGGGTIDWAYLRREGEDFEIVQTCPPSGDRHVGGHDVDEELLNIVRDKVGAEGEEEIEDRKTYYLGQVRRLKERYCRGLPGAAMKIGSQQVTLNAQEIQTVIDERFVSQTCEGLKSYLEKVKEATKESMPVVLLVGGSARLKGLRQAIEERLGCQTAWWERSEYATVLGAVPIQQLVTSGQSVVDSHQFARERYRTAVEMAWADQRLDTAERERLSTLANKLELMKEDAADIEQEVIGKSAEITAESQKPAVVVSAPRESNTNERASEHSKNTQQVADAGDEVSAKHAVVSSNPVTLQIHSPPVWMFWNVDNVVVFLDDLRVGVGSIKQGFDITVHISSGSHKLVVTVYGLVVKTTNYAFDCTPGKYRVTVHYSRTWGEYSPDTEWLKLE